MGSILRFHTIFMYMAIYLKDQLNQIKSLNEIVYHAPIFNTDYYKYGDHSSGRESGTRMFYDFYAIENLWSWVGSGSKSKKEREKMRSSDNDDPSKNIFDTVPKFILPHREVALIDDLFEQVTRAVAKNLINYTHLAVVQEFQYLISMGYGWTKFRQALVASYNQYGKMTNSEFNRLVEKYIPKMTPYPDTVKRLLKFSKYYSSMTTKDAQDVYDATRSASGTPKKEPSSATEPELEPDVQPSMPSGSEDPDTTDYSAEPVDVPPGADYDDDEPLDIPQKPGEDPENYFKKKKKQENLLKEEMINPSKIQAVYKSINKAGLTLDDIEKAYNNIEWGGAYGGPRWGAGAIALLKLMKAKKTENPEDLSHIIDHIYDLQHNTGSLLNKGPMYVSDKDLNRRFRTTHIARFLPFVSPIIRQVILRYLKYVHGDSELEKQKETIVNSPTKSFTSEEKQQLVAKGLQQDGDAFRANISFINKQKEQVDGVYYEIKFHQNGKYSVADNFRADIQVYDNFKDAFNYLMTYERDFINKSGFSYNNPPPEQSEKSKYINSHTKIKLSPERELELLDVCKMGWRQKSSSQYYKAYFSGAKRFQMYAFNDGTYLCTFNDTNAYKLFDKWNDCFNYCKSATDNAVEYPDYNAAKELISKSLGLPTTSTPKPSVKPSVPQSQPSSVTPTAYSPFGKELPPNASSKAIYTAHVGISIPPKNSIRLTKEDENTLTNIGFSPKIVGNDVWYIHNPAADTVKFYTNNQAKIIFVGQNSQPTVTMTIEKMLAWLPTKYNTGGKSPLTSPTSSQISQAGGSKAGSMFEKTITDAGFAWNPAKMNYSDGSSEIVIDPYPKSTIKKLNSGEILKTFNNLPSLASYLKNEYPTQKKTLASNKSKYRNLGLKIKKLLDLLKKGGFKHSGDSSYPGKSGKKYTNNNNDVVITYYDHTSSVYDSAHKNTLNFQDLNELITYLSEKYGSQHVPNGLTEAEYNDLNSAISANYPTLKVYKWHWADLPGDLNSNILFIIQNKPLVPGSKVPTFIKITKENEKYTLEGTKSSSTLAGINFNSLDWDAIKQQLYGLLNALVANKEDTNPIKVQFKELNTAEFNKLVGAIQNHDTNKKSYTIKYQDENPSQFPYAELMQYDNNYVVKYQIRATTDGYKINDGEGNTLKSYADFTSMYNDFLDILKYGDMDAADDKLTPQESKYIDDTAKEYGWTTDGNQNYIGIIKPTTGSQIHELGGMKYVIRKENDEFILYHNVTQQILAKSYNLVLLVQKLKQIMEEENKSSSNKTPPSNITQEEFYQLRDNIIYDPKINLAQWDILWVTDTDGENPYITIRKPNNNGELTPAFHLFVKDGKYVLITATPPGTTMASWDSFSGPYTWLNNAVNPNGPQDPPDDGGEEPPTPEHPTGPENEINDQEFNLIKDVVSKYNVLTAEKEQGQTHDGEPTSYAEIKTKNTGNSVWAVAKAYGNYVLFKVIGNPEKPMWDSILMSQTFEPIYDKLNEVLGVNFPTTNQSIEIPHNLEEKATNAGFQKKKNSNGDLWEHQSKFWFQTFTDCITWNCETGSRELMIPKEHQEKYLTKVLSKITPSTSNDDVDQIFNEASVSRLDKLFDQLLRSCRRLNGISLGRQFQSEMSRRGFDWNDFDKCYMNEEIYQSVSVQMDALFKTIFNVYWINKEETISHIQVSDAQTLYAMIGPSGNIVKWGNVPQPETPKIEKQLEPSGELYKKHDDEYNAKLIKLNDHDENLLYKLGFMWWPIENHYYKNKETGDVFKFYDTGGSVWHGNDDLQEFQTIPQALKFAISKYLKEPFSNQNYNENPTDETLNSIKLNDHDTEVLESLGFKWLEDKKKYIKKLGQSDTPNLEESDTSNANNEQFELIYAYNNGNATWSRTMEPWSDTSHSDLEIRNGTIIDILHFVWNRWNPEPTPEYVGKLMTTNGFKYFSTKVDGGVAYYNDEKNKIIYFYPNGKVVYHYQYILNPNTGELKWDITSFKWNNFLAFVNKDLKAQLKALPDKKKNHAQLLWAPWIQDRRVPTVGSGNQQNIKIKPSDNIVSDLKVYGYNWDNTSKQFVSNDDALDTITFMKDGNIIWYGGMGTEEKMFSGTEELWKFLDWGGISKSQQKISTSTPPEKKVTGQMPYSGVNYGEWFNKNSPEIAKNYTIELNPNDELLLTNELGFYKKIILSQDPEFKIGYYGPNNQIMYFFASGKASYWQDGEGPKYFDTVKDGIQFLWDKHMPFIEEKITFKNLMKSLLE